MTQPHPAFPPHYEDLWYAILRREHQDVVIPILQAFLLAEPHDDYIGFIADLCRQEGAHATAMSLGKWISRRRQAWVAAAVRTDRPVLRAGGPTAAAAGTVASSSAAATSADSTSADSAEAQPAPNNVFNLRPEDMPLTDHMPVDRLRREARANNDAGRTRAHDLHSQQLHRINEQEQAKTDTAKAHARKANADADTAEANARAAAFRADNLPQEEKRKERKLVIEEAKEARQNQHFSLGETIGLIGAAAGVSYLGFRALGAFESWQDKRSQRLALPASTTRVRALQSGSLGGDVDGDIIDAEVIEDDG